MKLIAIAAQLFINGEYRSSCTSNGAYRCDHNLDRTTAHACAPLVPALAGPEARLPPRHNGRSSPPATKVTAAPLQGGGGARALSTWTRRGCCRLAQRAVYGQAERNVSRRRRRSRFRFCCHLRVRGAGRRSDLIARRVNLMCWWLPSGKILCGRLGA
jgi:hypothetical protein